MPSNSELLDGKVLNGKIVIDAPEHLADGTSVKVRLMPSMSTGEKLFVLREMQSHIVPGTPVPAESLRRENLYED
ncbi:MAG TPA: hypothetical protein VK934_05305 [Fimbriimonas sp.]|nr:hypothetical protein [Fimbriimonas sp.]